MLDLGAQGCPERNRIHEVPAVGRHARAETLALRDRRARVFAFGDVKAPGVVEVVLRARALDGRRLLAVHVEHVVAFAEPAGLGLKDREHGPDVKAAALRVEKDPGLSIGGSRQSLAVPRMEVRGVRGKRGNLLPVHVVVETDAPRAFVRDGDPAGFPERHRPVAVAGPAVGEIADHERANRPLEAVSDREEVAVAATSTLGVGAAVVVNANAQEARPAVLGARCRRPDVRHDARAGQIGDGQCLPRQRMLAVVVPVGQGRVRRRAMSGEVLQLREVDRIHGARDRGLAESGSASCGEEDGAKVKSHGVILFR